jgi:cytochrome c peroxidase
VGLPIDKTLAAIPPDNPQTAEKIALGQKLFFDGRLSVDGTVACATCHDPQRAFTDGRPTSIGVQGRSGQRNAPTVLNALYNKTQFWDGRAKTLEEQAALPIANPVEMGQPDLEAAAVSLAALPEYQQAFQNVFGRAPNGQDLVAALASYERMLTSFDSPFDRFLAGDARAIDDAAKRGWVLFNDRARCNKCHALPDETPDLTNFKDDDFHNIGVLIVRHHVVPLARSSHASARCPGRTVPTATRGAPSAGRRRRPSPGHRAGAHLAGVRRRGMAPGRIAVGRASNAPYRQ